jgi:hypothetical protein
MLSPAFQKFKSDNSELVTQVFLNDESSQKKKDIEKFWVITLFKNFSSPITPDNSVTAYVDINTGQAILPEVENLIRQFDNVSNRLK